MKLFVLLALLLGFGISAQAQTEEQLRKFLEGLPAEETEDVAEELPMMNIDEVMKAYSAAPLYEHPGGIEAWPGAEKFKQWGISIKQPAGTKAKHDGSGEQWSNLRIYLKCDNADAAIADLVKQAEAATNVKPEILTENEIYDAKGKSVKITSYYFYMERWNLIVSQVDGGYVSLTLAYPVQ